MLGQDAEKERIIKNYDRQIKYFGYWEKEQRLRNCGFVKLELRDGNCYMGIHISGLQASVSNTYKVYLMSGKNRIPFCDIQLADGKGSKELCLPGANLCGGIGYETLEALEIPISRTKVLQCVIRESMCTAEPLHTAYEEAPDKTEAEAATTQVPLHDSKWRQLWEVYPHITPFDDAREYLSVGPGDFVVLAEKYYKLINNSFLLHGFYNYRHLILTRLEKKGELRYYMGVPGNFYEREKQVALMFGFESFECREEPASVGEFGYYMMRVDL